MAVQTLIRTKLIDNTDKIFFYQLWSEAAKILLLQILVLLTSRDSAQDLRFQKGIKGAISITQVTSDLVKLKNNRGLTAKGMRQSIIPVIKTCTWQLWTKNDY